MPGQLPPSAADIGETPTGTSPIKLQQKTRTTTQAKTPAQIAQEAGEKRLQTLKDQARVVSGITEEERRMLQLEVAIEGIERNRNLLGDELADKLIAAEQNLVAQTVLAKQLTKEEKERIAAADKLAREMQKQKEMFAQIGQTIKDGIVDSIMSAVDGTKSLGESLSGILRQLGRMFLNQGVSQLLTS